MVCGCPRAGRRGTRRSRSAAGHPTGGPGWAGDPPVQPPDLVRRLCWTLCGIAAHRLCCRCAAAADPYPVARRSACLRATENCGVRSPLDISARYAIYEAVWRANPCPVLFTKNMIFQNQSSCGSMHGKPMTESCTDVACNMVMLEFC